MAEKRYNIPLIFVITFTRGPLGITKFVSLHQVLTSLRLPPSPYHKTPMNVLAQCLSVDGVLIKGTS